MHKLMNGQPGEQMPALRALDHQVVLDLLAHLKTLPTAKYCCKLSAIPAPPMARAGMV
jgi:hypothetical protein